VVALSDLSGPLPGHERLVLTAEVPQAERKAGGDQRPAALTATNSGGSATADSDPFVIPAVAPQNTTAPSISGTPAVGQVLSCDPGTFTGTPAPTRSFAWLRDGQAIAGATGSAYTVTAADAGRQLSCRVTATNVAGSAVATSAAVAVPAAPVPSPTPSPSPSPSPSPTPAPTAEEVLAQAPASQVVTAFGLPSARTCLSRRNFTIRLRQPRGVTIRSAIVFVNNKRVRVRKVAGRFTAQIDLRGLPKGAFTVKLRITTTSGRKINGQRRYRTCSPKRRAV